MKADSTVAQNIFALVRAEFRLGTERINKGEILEWTVPYTEKGETKTANKDTVARKLRTLVEANYLGVEYEKGQAWIVKAKGEPRALKEEPTDAPEAPNLASRDELPAPKYRYEQVFENGRLIKVLAIPV